MPYLSVRLSVCLSVRPHGTTQLPLDGFLWNLTFEYFSKICRENSNLIKTLTRITSTLHADRYTGLFLSPSGISDPCGTVAGMVTPKGSMSTEGETLQVSVLPTLQVLDMCTLGDAADVNPVIKFLRHALQHLAVDSSDCLHDPLSQLR